MKSSYQENRYSNVFKTIAYLIQPKKIVEFGILEAYSLMAWIDSTPDTTQIEAHDIFEEFPYNAANYNVISEKFKKYPNVSIHRNNFYGAQKSFKHGEIDILHIDIANDGEVYLYALENYMQLVSHSGVCILEGGSKERDEVYWMNEFNKPKIQPIIMDEKYNNLFEIRVLEDYPSITLIMHKEKK